MLPKAAALSILALAANAEIAQMYQQCGGINWKGATQCAYPATCYSQNPYYYQCTTLAYTPETESESTTVISLANTITATESESTTVISLANTITAPASESTTVISLGNTITDSPSGLYWNSTTTATSTKVAPMWGQCGGEDWAGPTVCAEPATCLSVNPWYYQCTTTKGEKSKHHPTTTSTSTSSTSHHTKPEKTGVVGMWSQCGGINWEGPTKCAEPATCYSQNPYYYQCTTFPSPEKGHHTSPEKEHHDKSAPSTSHKTHPHKPTTLATKHHDGHN